MAVSVYVFEKSVITGVICRAGMETEMSLPLWIEWQIKKR